MTLLARLDAAEGRAPRTTCAIDTCSEPRVEGALFGRDCGHNNDWIAGRITRRGDGTFELDGPRPRATVSPFVALAQAGELPAKAIS